MNDTIRKKTLHVSTDGSAGPYAMVPVDKIENVRALLDSHDIGYWVDEDAIRVDDEPYITVVNFSKGVDTDKVRNILDSVL